MVDAEREALIDIVSLRKGRNLKGILVFSSMPKSSNVISWPKALSSQKVDVERFIKDVERIEILPEDNATILYTSGTYV